MRTSALHLRHHHKAITSTHQSLHFSSSLPSPLLESQNPSLNPLPIQTLQTHRRLLVNLLQLGLSNTPKTIHARILALGFRQDVFLANLLLDSYKKSGSIVYARKVFDTMLERSAVTWSSMVSMYTKHGKSEEALKVFLEFHRSSDGRPNEYTLPSVVRACTQFGGADQGAQVHCFVVKTGFDKDVFVGTSLVDFYVKMGEMEEARLVFENDQQFHSQIIKFGLENDPFVTNALVDMYSKCGSINEAHKIFDSKTSKDVACWNSIISTYAHHGEAEKALLMFERMMKEEINPNYITFVGVLSACSHAGLVEDGLRHFESMHLFGIEPGIDHYSCIVSLLGRAGQLSEAKELIEKMPMKPAAILWRSLLSACTAAGNVELGIYAAEKAILSDPMDSGSYILLSNIYAAEGMWDDVKKIREKMEYNGVVKDTGRSWV